MPLSDTGPYRFPKNEKECKRKKENVVGILVTFGSPDWPPEILLPHWQ
jgi:hypothetical protein